MIYRNDFIVSTNDDALHDTMNGTVTGKLIRCKDCKHQVVSRIETPGKTFELKYCAYCTASGVLGNDNDFCSMGSRK